MSGGQGYGPVPMWMGFANGAINQALRSQAAASAAQQQANLASYADAYALIPGAGTIDLYRNVARAPLAEHHQRIKRMADWLEAELAGDHLRKE